MGEETVGPLPSVCSDGELSGLELARLAERGGAFDWLADDPDLYVAEDGDPV